MECFGVRWCMECGGVRWLCMEYCTVVYGVCWCTVVYSGVWWNVCVFLVQNDDVSLQQVQPSSQKNLSVYLFEWAIAVRMGLFLMMIGEVRGVWWCTMVYGGV